MKKTIEVFILFLISSALKGLRANHTTHMEMTKLKMSLMYVRSIKTFRLLFLSLLSIGVCLVFLMTGLILLHISLFLYTPWSMETKMTIGLLCSVFYLLVTFGMFFQIFASDRWLKIFNADAIIDHLRKEAGTKPIE